MRPNSANETPEFDRYARSYAQLLDDPLRNRFAHDPLHFHRRKMQLIESLLKRFRQTPQEMRWLDVGCGQGQLLELAGRSFRQAAGCDPSADMLSSKSPFILRQQPSPGVLPFRAGSFELVTAVCVYHHVHGQDRALLTGEIRRVLTPGGICCIIEHNPWNPVTRAIVRRCPVDVDAELLSAPETHSLLRTSGFEPMTTDYFLFLPERLFQTMGSLEEKLRNVPLGGQYASVARVPHES